MLDNDNASLTTLDDATPELDLFSIFGDSPQTTALDFESPLLLSSPMFSSDANPMFTDSGFTQKSTLSQQPDFYFPPLQSELVQQQPVNFAPLPAEQPTLAPSDTVTLTIAQLSQLLAANQPVQRHQLKAVKSHACPQCGRRVYSPIQHAHALEDTRQKPSKTLCMLHLQQVIHEGC